MSETNHPIAIVVALLGAIATLGAALIGNWDRIFPPSSDAPSTLAPPRAPPTASLPAVEPVARIEGLWLDRDHPGNRSSVLQEGNGFRFTRWGLLPNGAEFTSTGSGTIAGQRVSSSYVATYQSGATSTGDCSGVLSANGTRLELTCRDSLLGTFPIVAERP